MLHWPVCVCTLTIIIVFSANKCNQPSIHFKPDLLKISQNKLNCIFINLFLFIKKIYLIRITRIANKKNYNDKLELNTSERQGYDSVNAVYLNCCKLNYAISCYILCFGYRVQYNYYKSIRFDISITLWLTCEKVVEFGAVELLSTSGCYSPLCYFTVSSSREGDLSSQ